MDLADIEQLIDIIRDAQISELTISAGKPKTTVRLKKAACAVAAGDVGETAPISEPGRESVIVTSTAYQEELAELYITAPMVGIFHAIDNLTAIGSPIKAGQVVGAIESMKLMNDVLSTCDGIVTEVLMEDGMAVEYGQNLFALQPAVITS